MTRKFNAGRQSEQIFNRELHDLFMALKYLNSGNTKPTQDEQAEIPNGALWQESYFDKNILNTYNALSKQWTPFFKGYYHPADVFTKPDTPVNGQLWIDATEGNLLKSYDSNTSSWIAVSAIQADVNGNIGAYNNFILINPLKPSLNKSYLVPSEEVGRLYDTASYIHPSDPAYVKGSAVSFDYTSKLPGNESWLHVNAKNLNKVEKRLIKVITDSKDPNAYTIELFDHNTEFYKIDKTTGLGTILLPNLEDPKAGDYIKTDYGIKLLKQDIEYVYAISYGFGSYAKRPGSLIRKSGVVKTQDTVFIGNSTEHAFVFLDGLYLEQSKYTHDRSNQSIVITGDDITELMDLTVVTFPDYAKNKTDGNPLELTINHTNIQGVDAVVGPIPDNAKTFVKPMAFVSGLNTNPASEPVEVIIQGDQATIKNIGPMEENDIFKVMIIEANGVYCGTGTVSATRRIESELIDITSNYMLFVDGILISPRDLDIADGSIGAMGLKEGQHWSLIKANPANYVDIIFDSAVSHFSVKIEDNNEATIFNDCDEAIVFVDTGTLVDRDAINKYKLPPKGINGQIIVINNPISESDTTIEYYQWTRSSNKWNKISDTSLFETIDLIVNGYFATRGSISIINKKFVDKPYTYYAYTLINGIDEPLLFGYRDTVEGLYNYKVNLKHEFMADTGSLITHVNGLRAYPTETGNSSFKLDEIDSISTIDWKGEQVQGWEDKDNALDNGYLTYIVEKPEANETTSYMRQTLTPRDRIEGYTNTYQTKVSLMPGHLTVYVNGLRLPREEFAVIDQHTLVLYRDVVGGQSINDISDNTTWNKFTYNTLDGLKTIDCLSFDTIEIEVRNDLKIKELSIPVRYAGQNIFTVEDDGIPKSLITSRDFLKIYINGVFYGDEYEIHEDNQFIALVNMHTLETLGTDPIDMHFKKNPAAYEKYQEEYGKPYYAKQPKDIITFEWR